MKTIYTITGVNTNPFRTRCFGWYSNIDTAIVKIEHNCMDLNENGSYRYVVLELVTDGLHPRVQCKWVYKYNLHRQRYEMLEPSLWPSIFSKNTNFGIG